MSDALDLFFGQIDAFFQATVQVELLGLQDNNQNRQFADKTQITLREPLFAFKSGMATYNVNRIFPSIPWFPLLLQEF